MVSKKPKQLYYFFCNHWTQGGIGYAFPSGWYNGKKYERTFSSVYTIHKMLDAADDYPGLKVSMELDSFCYEEVLREDPACIERLRNYIKEGKAGIDGGTYGQPFGQDYGWEPNIRHLTYGRRTAKEILDYDVKAFLVEEQWFHPQLPQLLLKSGYQYASLQNQNSGQVKPMNKAMINWVGIDGSKLPTIPANNLMVSCVRQYTDYAIYQDILEEYDNPLLFQWVEVWAPGMDWGASATPFEKAIHQVLHGWKAKSVTLGDYFECEAKQRELEDIYIPLDDSNYINNWYQDGGWGYDGDRVMLQDKKAEQSLLAYETWTTMLHLNQNKDYPQQQLHQLWKKFMTLQNHDYSAARGYRVFTEEGLKTNAGSLAVVEYNRILKECNVETERRLQDSVKPGLGVTFFNPMAVSHQRTVEMEIPIPADESFRLKQGEKEVLFQVLEENNGKIKGLAVVELPSTGAAFLAIEPNNSTEAAENHPIQSGDTWIEDETLRVEWIPGTWKAKITHKNSAKSVTFTAFTGPIGKVNEHDAHLYPALSPGHEVFSFAFDGTTHCPDQLTWPKAEIEKTGPVQSTLKLYSNVLTLYTTPTPVAFAEARIHVDHLTGRVECESHFYTGVWLSLQCWAEFTHDFTDAEYYRDFPFGEEKTEIEFVYPNTYTRVISQEQGFTLVHPGVQRARIKRQKNGGSIQHLIARDKVMGDYTWKFALHFGIHQPWESISFSQTEHAQITQFTGAVEPDSFLTCVNPRLVVSAIYQDGEDTIIRLVNYSPEEIASANLFLTYDFESVKLIDFTGNQVGTPNMLKVDSGVTLELSFQPWEILTLALRNKEVQ